MTKISAIVLCKNEEGTLAKCLSSIKWCDEIIVIDDFSEDRSGEVAKKFGAKIIQRQLNGDFAEQRNYALKKAAYPWILFLDADEVLPSSLKSEIVRHLGKNPQINGYYLKRKDVFFDKEINYGENANIKLLRLGKKNNGSWKGKVHEKWLIKGKTKTLTSPIIHYPHVDLTELFSKINHYSSIRAKELYLNSCSSNALKIIAYPIAKFLKNYIFYQGFRDGTHGFVLAASMSLHSFLVRSKLYILSHEKNRN
jgi:glycosyltransferase involved in cell wall biosynthesis